VRLWRVGHGLSMKELGGRLGVAASTVLPSECLLKKAVGTLRTNRVGLSSFRTSAALLSRVEASGVGYAVCSATDVPG